MVKLGLIVGNRGFFPDHLCNSGRKAVIELLDNENTIPFIARYRKEATGNLDEEQIRQIDNRVERLRSLDKRRKTILSTIEEQGKLTPTLQKKIMDAGTMTELEDLYLPYKPKRRTRASIARENGLERLALSIMRQGRTGKTPEQMAKSYINDKVPTVEDALAGARDIVAETISEIPEIRMQTRIKALKWGNITSQKNPDVEDKRQVFERYYDFNQRVDRIRPHQILALNRGEKEKVLRVKIETPERDWREAISAHFHPDPKANMFAQLIMAIEDAANRLLLPAIERDIRRMLTEKAEGQAIGVFASNLKSLLNQPPLVDHTVIGIDPGFRTGCKVAVVDQTGKVLDTTTIYPHAPQKKHEEAQKSLGELATKHKATLITIGNGTASRETEALVAELIKEHKGVHYLITNEAGASVYSASPLAGKELPDMDVSMRGAVSIARRVQDPLAELVKIEPKSIGVGMYQHDVNASELEHTLNGVVESVVNNIGVDLNSASPSLLTYISGIGPSLAERIVAYRDENGSFRDRTQLQHVSGLGPKAFEQSAGFLRIRNGDNPMDASAIHPESYMVATRILAITNLDLETRPEKRADAFETLLQEKPLDVLSQELETGTHTLEDIFEQLLQPGRDPRQDLPKPILRSDVLSIDDLSVGMRLMGTVRNVVDFGAFVDIGIKNDGLLHRSQISSGTVLQIGDVIEVEISKIEAERGRISFKLIS
ncbi:MAG: RNA-binding transcriptional accessory protein [Anaerolineaceae bacterium]|nr:RNA-binding transcriptional accessory protein [Anaerolineaceae bacterium]